MKTTKAKIAFAFLTITLPIWAIPACGYALYCVFTGKDNVTFSVL